jgi:Glycosyl transferase family 90
MVPMPPVRGAERIQNPGNLTSSNLLAADEGRGMNSTPRFEVGLRTTTQPAAPTSIGYHEFPRWGEEGIHLPAMLEYAMESLESKKSVSFSNILYVWGGPSTPGAGGVWVSEELRRRTERPQLRYRAMPVESALKRAWSFVMDHPNNTAVQERWPSLLRTMGVSPNASNSEQWRGGFPLIFWYGDFRGCNQRNHQDNASVPLLTTCAKVTCEYAFPFPNYRTIRDSLSQPSDWDAVLEQQWSIHPWNEKIPKLLWRGGLTGALLNYTSARCRLGMFALKHRDDPLLDIGIHQIPPRHYHPTTKKAIPPDLAKRILIKPAIPAANFSNYRAILDTDGNSWSSRFGRLLCRNSVVLKVEPHFVDYFYRFLQPWVHYVPVRYDLADLLEKVEWVLDVSNDNATRRIVSEANAWCRQHMTLDAVMHDMLDALETYVSYLDRGDAHWMSHWKEKAPGIWDLASEWKMRKL